MSLGGRTFDFNHLTVLIKHYLNKIKGFFFWGGEGCGVKGATADGLFQMGLNRARALCLSFFALKAQGARAPSLKKAGATAHPTASQ